jgi:hypothetical protein
VIPARVEKEAVTVSIPVASFTPPEDDKPVSAIEVRLDPVYVITEVGL